MGDGSEVSIRVPRDSPRYSSAITEPNSQTSDAAMADASPASDAAVIAAPSGVGRSRAARPLSACR